MPWQKTVECDPDMMLQNDTFFLEMNRIAPQGGLRKASWSGVWPTFFNAMVMDMHQICLQVDIAGWA